MKQTRSRGWFYFIVFTFLSGIYFLNRDADVQIPDLKIILYSVITGYIAGVIFYSLSDLIFFCLKWLFNYQNYRYLASEGKRKPRVRIRLIPDYSRRKSQSV